MKILDKNPLKGGIPATEKKMTIKEKPHKLFILKKFDRFDKNNEDGSTLLKVFTFF